VGESQKGWGIGDMKGIETGDQEGGEGRGWDRMGRKGRVWGWDEWG